MDPNRREFLHACAAGAIGAVSANGTPHQIVIHTRDQTTFLSRLAERELLRGLEALRLSARIVMSDGSVRPAAGAILMRLSVDRARFRDPESYSITAKADGLEFTGASEQALLYSVFDFLERQGAFFGIDGESYPLEAGQELCLPPNEQVWTASPRFAVRGLLPWPDFLNCISVYNEEDFRAYFESMLRMRFNTFGMHVYTGANQWAESYLSFEFGGVGHLGFLDNSASHRWGYLPQRTSRYAMGASQFYDSEVFGSDATRLARDPWETAERTRMLLRNAFDYAHRLGLRTGIGFEPYQIPDEILRALPPEAKIGDPKSRGPRFDIDSVAARKLIETRLAQLLEAYPDADHVWLWEDENMNWSSRKGEVTLSVTPFMQAYDFLRRNAPKKRLVLGGWGGVARNFDYFHQKLPMDVIFSCLSDSLGWDPPHEVFGKMEGRERWPIPWLEDDPAMWLPQFHVHRFEKDMNRAEQFGCQGLIGIHWRHRIVDPTAGFQSRFSWDRKLSPAEYYRAYARTQAAAPRAPELARALDDADANARLLSTFTGEFKDGHAVHVEFAGDYSEGFTFWSGTKPVPGVPDSQKQVAATLRSLTDQASSPAERERLEYLTRHIEFLVPYTEAWTLAQSVHAVLTKAAELKKAGHPEQAREIVRTEAVPLWLRLAPEVRRAMLMFQSIIATRNDLGTLASMQNKFVRLALVRLRLSMQEYLGELPPETERAFADVTGPDPNAPARVFIPTRPTVLAKNEKVRVMIVVAGTDPVRRVILHTRLRGSRQWQVSAAKLMGRRTYEASVGPFPATARLAEYYVSAETAGGRLVAPAGGPKMAYSVTLV